jgi:hypothetical protein
MSKVKDPKIGSYNAFAYERLIVLIKWHRINGTFPKIWPKKRGIGNADWVNFSGGGKFDDSISENFITESLVLHDVFGQCHSADFEYVLKSILRCSMTVQFESILFAT